MVDTTRPSCLITQPAGYRIRVPGRLHPLWCDYVHGMAVSTMETEDQGTVTELTGTLPDQAALIGIV